jgi:hypothetical protein
MEYIKYTNIYRDQKRKGFFLNRNLPGNRLSGLFIMTLFAFAFCCPPATMMSTFERYVAYIYTDICFVY